MTLLDLYLRGLAIGFAIAAAIGPIGLLCIRRTLADGRAIGLATGLGAATADALYAAVAAFGLTAVSSVLIDERRPLGIVGGTLLMLLAARMWWQSAGGRAASVVPDPSASPAGRRAGQPAAPIAPDPGTSRAAARLGLPAAYATTLGLTITNPATILSFAAAFVGFGLVSHGGPGAVALVLGVFAGSSAWWVLLVATVGALRPRVGPVALRRVAVASAALIAAIGAVAVWTSLLSG